MKKGQYVKFEILVRADVVKSDFDFLGLDDNVKVKKEAAGSVSIVQDVESFEYLGHVLGGAQKVAMEMASVAASDAMHNLFLFLQADLVKQQEVAFQAAEDAAKLQDGEPAGDEAGLDAGPANE